MTNTLPSSEQAPISYYGFNKPQGYIDLQPVFDSNPANPYFDNGAYVTDPRFEHVIEGAFAPYSDALGALQSLPGSNPNSPAFDAVATAATADIGEAIVNYLGRREEELLRRLHEVRTAQKLFTGDNLRQLGLPSAFGRLAAQLAFDMSIRYGHLLPSYADTDSRGYVLADYAINDGNDTEYALAYCAHSGIPITDSCINIADLLRNTEAYTINTVGTRTYDTRMMTLSTYEELADGGGGVAAITTDMPYTMLFARGSNGRPNLTVEPSVVRIDYKTGELDQRGIDELPNDARLEFRPVTVLATVPTSHVA